MTYLRKIGDVFHLSHLKLLLKKSLTAIQRRLQNGYSTLVRVITTSAVQKKRLKESVMNYRERFKEYWKRETLFRVPLIKTSKFYINKLNTVLRENYLKLKKRLR